MMAALVVPVLQEQQLIMEARSMTKMITIIQAAVGHHNRLEEVVVTHSA
jgi:hypothetical protein